MFHIASMLYSHLSLDYKIAEKFNLSYYFNASDPPTISNNSLVMAC